MRFIRIIKSRDLKIRKTRYGIHAGPLPSINFFSDNSDTLYIDISWEDKTKSENRIYDNTDNIDNTNKSRIYPNGFYNKEALILLLFPGKPVNSNICRLF